MSSRSNRCSTAARIAPVAEELIVVLHIPSLFEVRAIGSIVKLIYRTTPQQADDELGGKAIIRQRRVGRYLLNYLCFCVTASEILPVFVRGAAKCLFREYKTVRLKPERVKSDNRTGLMRVA